MLAPNTGLIWFQLLAVCLYVFLGRLLLRGQRTRQWYAAFALLNVAAVYFLFFSNKDPRYQPLFSGLFGIYLLLVCVQYAAARLWAGSRGMISWIAFLTPIAFLAVIRYAPFEPLVLNYDADLFRVLQRHPEFTPIGVFVGFSYMAFRTSYLVLEVRNGVARQPGFWEYLGFAFFAPTMSVGPIASYSEYHRAFEPDAQSKIRPAAAMLRVLIGAVKYKFLGPLLYQLTYAGLLLDGHPHLWIDLPIAAIAYYLYLYCNFSGFCDIAIGGAGLMGISIAENFANPFGARDMADFWNRWHITLSHYMRDVVFSPLSRALVRIVGPLRAKHAIALTIITVFLIVGIWHGVGWNYAAFGAAHGLGVVVNHYYTIFLKKRLGKEGYAAYMKNRVIHATAVSLTFVYVTATLFLFANDWTAMTNISSVLRW